MTNRQTNATRATWLTLAALLLTLALAPPPASAGTYTVHSCRLPNGAPTGAAGWKSRLSGFGTFANNTCERGGALSAGFSAYGDHLRPAGRPGTSRSPADLTVSNAFIFWRYARVHYAMSGRRQRRRPTTGSDRRTRAMPPTRAGDSLPGRKWVPRAGSPSWTTPSTPQTAATHDPRTDEPDANIELPHCHLNCGRSGARLGARRGPLPDLIIFAAQITMRDDLRSHHYPACAASLSSGGDLRDTVSAEVFGADRGPGLRSAAIEVDGREVTRGTLPTDARAHVASRYSNPRPCALQASARLSTGYPAACRRPAPSCASCCAMPPATDRVPALYHRRQ